MRDITLITRSLLQRGLLSWSAIVQFGASIAILFSRGLQWRGDVVWTIDWIPVSLMIAGPAISAFSAIDTSRLEPGVGHMSRNRATRTPSLAVLIAYLIVSACVHLLVVAVALALSQPVVPDPFAWLAVLVQVMIVGFFAVLGTAVGRFANPLMAGILGALGAFGAMYIISSPGSSIALLAYGGSTLPRLGWAYNPSFLVGQAGMLVGVALAAQYPRPIDGRHVKRVRVRDALKAGVAIAAVAAISAAAPAERLKPVSVVPNYCRAVASVPVCFYPQHRRIASAFQGQLEKLFTVASEKGYEGYLPTKVEEASRTRLPQEGDLDVAAIYVMPEHLRGEVPTLWELALGFLQPLHCPQTQGELPPSDQYWEDLNAVTATWVELADPGSSEENGYFEAPLSASEAARLVDEFRSCIYDGF